MFLRPVLVLEAELELVLEAELELAWRLALVLELESELGWGQECAAPSPRKSTICTTVRWRKS